MSGRVGRTAAFYFATQVGSTVAGFLATWYINVALGAAVFGEFSTAIALMFWLNVPASAIGEALKKRTSEGEEPGAYLAVGHLLNLAVHVGLVGGLVVFREQVNIFVGADVAVLFAALVGARAIFDVTVSSLRGFKQVGTSGAVKTFEQVLRSGVHIGALFFLGVGVAGLVAGYVTSLLVATAAGLLLLDGRPSRPRRKHLASVIDYARFAWLGTLKTRAFTWTDVLVMRGLSLSVVGLAAVSKSQIGIYKVSWTAASVLALASMGIKETLFPEFSDLAAQGEYDRVHHYLTEALTFSGVVAIPGIFGAVVVGETVLTVFGPEYATGGTILVLLVLARLLAAYAGQFLGAINATDNPDVAFRVNLAYVVANVVLNLALVTLFGWYGAAFATVLSAFFSLFAAGYALSSLVGAPTVPVGELARQVAASLVMFGAVLGLRSVLPGTLAWTLVVVGAGAAVYGVVLLAISTKVRTKAASLAPV
jgi:O-antigen/teichoic acid export membrane protein